MRLIPCLLVAGLISAGLACGGDDDTTAGGDGGFPPGAPGAQLPGSQTPGSQTPGVSLPGAQMPGAQMPGTGLPGEGLCEKRNVNAYGTLPDMLIVMDRSLSTAATRWAPSVNAVTSITRDFEGLLDFGLSLFPLSTDQVPFGCAPGKIDVPVMSKNAAAIGMTLSNTVPNGQTPTGATLQAALQTLGPRHGSIDGALAKPAYVLLVTDGQPSCSLGGADPAQEQAARDAVKALKDANIPTYVIGYEIMGNYQALMNELAQLGGTGMYYDVKDAAGITAAFREITKDVVKCEFELSEVPSNPELVRVEIDGKTIALNAADGWVIAGKKVTLQGGSCATLKDGKGHILNAQVECTPVVIN